MSKPFTRAELLAMPYAHLVELINSGSEELDRISAEDFREICVAQGLFAKVEDEVEDDAEAASSAPQRWQETLKRDLLESDRQSVLDEQFENTPTAEIPDALTKAQRNQRLREAGQADLLDNSDDPGEVESQQPPRDEQGRFVSQTDTQEYEDHKFVLNASDAALDDALKAKTGLTTAEVAQLKEQAIINRSQEVQREFLAKHPDFIANDTNANLLRDFAIARGATVFTPELLEQGFETYKSIVTAKTEATQPQPRNGRRSSSVSSRGKSAPAVPTGPSEAQLYSMPMDDLRTLCIEKAKSSDDNGSGWGR